MTEIDVFYEATPNPHSLKFVLTSSIADGSVNFASATETARSPLARKIFAFPWAAGVYVGPNFVTVTKQDWVDWDVLADPLAGLIKEHLERGEAVLLPALTDDDSDASDSGIVRQIKQILREEIRPAVAMDGGDIVFDKYDADLGRVHLHMQGACAGCPSSAITLKDGIEQRLKQAIPEIQDVVQA